MISVSAIADKAAIWARSWAAPNEQLRPIDSGRAWRTEAQKLSIEWPERLRPERSVIVIDSMIGSVARSTRRAAWIAGLGVQRVEHGLDQDEIDAAFDQRLDLLDIDVGDRVEIDLAIAGIVDVGRQRQGLVGRPDRAGDPALPAVRHRRPRG